MRLRTGLRSGLRTGVLRSHAATVIIAAVVPVLYDGDRGGSAARLPDVRGPCYGHERCGDRHAAVRFVVSPDKTDKPDTPDRPDRWTVELTGVPLSATTSPEAWTRVLAVYAVPSDTIAMSRVATDAIATRSAAGGLLTVVTPDGSVEALPPMIGRYEVDCQRSLVRFVPRYPPAAGVTYIARAAGAADARFAPPAASGAATTRVAAIYPSTVSVPANLLKLHIEFSAPMSDGEAHERLRLLDARGREVVGAFLHVDEELWDASRRRLTVLFDPGRIKRGLRANLEEGTPLDAGRTFRLAIDGRWRDGQGLPLVSGVEKRLMVEAPDRTSPDWRRWTLQPPIAGTTVPLRVQFDEPLDRVLLDRWLVVTDAAGRRVSGQVVVGSEESSWAFVPGLPWSAQRYQVLIDPRLEDRAANSLRALFDSDVDATGEPSDSGADQDGLSSLGGPGGHAVAGRAAASAPVVLPFTPRRAIAPGT